MKKNNPVGMFFAVVISGGEVSTGEIIERIAPGMFYVGSETLGFLVSAKTMEAQRWGFFATPQQRDRAVSELKKRK